MRSSVPGVLLALLIVFLSGCRYDMQDQPKAKTFRMSRFFDDNLSARPLVAGTVAQGQLDADELLYTGKVNGQPADVFPFAVTRQVLERGQERYNIFCSPCHGRTGDGNGIVVQRGFRPAANYHTERLRKAPAGHFFDAITNGFGAMYAYRDRIDPSDRWAIIAYIRALQLSWNATLADVPAGERTKLEGVAR